MVVMTREAWTDERLDDLKSAMTESFSWVDAELRELRAEIAELREVVRTQGADLQKAMLHGFIAVFVAMFTGFAALAGLIVAL